MANQGAQTLLTIAAARGTITVLLVDDHKFVGDVLGRLLATETDIALHCCYSGVDAVALANHINPTIILQDLILPDIDGLALVRLFRANAQTANTPVIVLSGNDDADSRARARSEGANDYLRQAPAQGRARRLHPASCGGLGVCAMKNLKVWQKLALMGAVFMLPFAVVTYTMVSSIDTLGADFARQELRGLEYYSPLSTLLQDLQQHRDMSSAWLSGDASFKERLDGKSADIESDIKKVDEADQRLNTLLHIGTRWAALSAASRDLLAKTRDQPADQKLRAAHESDRKHHRADPARGRSVQPHSGSRPRQLLPHERHHFRCARLERVAGPGTRSRQRPRIGQARHVGTIRPAEPFVAPRRIHAETSGRVAGQSLEGQRNARACDRSVHADRRRAGPGCGRLHRKTGRQPQARRQCVGLLRDSRPER